VSLQQKGTFALATPGHSRGGRGGRRPAHYRVRQQKVPPCRGVQSWAPTGAPTAHAMVGPMQVPPADAHAVAPPSVPLSLFPPSTWLGAPSAAPPSRPEPASGRAWTHVPPADAHASALPSLPPSLSPGRASAVVASRPALASATQAPPADAHATELPPSISWPTKSGLALHAGASATAPATRDGMNKLDFIEHFRRLKRGRGHGPCQARTGSCRSDRRGEGFARKARESHWLASASLRMT
jgi:hypothetical protein